MSSSKFLPSSAVAYPFCLISLSNRSARSSACILQSLGKKCTEAIWNCYLKALGSIMMNLCQHHMPLLISHHLPAQRPVEASKFSQSRMFATSFRLKSSKSRRCSIMASGCHRLHLLVDCPKTLSHHQSPMHKCLLHRNCPCVVLHCLLCSLHLC